MSIIKTELNRRISELVGQISSPKLFYMHNNVVTEIDYHKVMKEYFKIYDSTGIDGTKEWTLAPPKGYTYEIHFLQTMIDTDATVADRFLRFEYHNDNESPGLLFRSQFKTAITASQIKWKSFSRFGEASIHADYENIQLHEPMIIQYPDYITLELFNGVAGDEYNLHGRAWKYHSIIEPEEALPPGHD